MSKKPPCGEEDNIRGNKKEMSESRPEKRRSSFVRLVENRNGLVSWGGADAEFFQLGARATLLFGARIALDDLAEFADASGLLSLLDERQALFEARSSELEALGIVGEHAIVFGDGLIVVSLRVGNLAELELRV
jgi:hypothetical protein